MIFINVIDMRKYIKLNDRIDEIGDIKLQLT